MLKHSSSALFLLASSILAQAAQPSAADLARLNRSLNPTPTPNLYGLETHLNTGGQDVDAQGNHLFTQALGSDQDGREQHLSAANAKPTAAFKPLWGQLRDFEAQVADYEQRALISRARAGNLRERLDFLRIRAGLDRHPDGSALSKGQAHSLSTGLAHLKKDLLR